MIVNILSARSSAKGYAGVGPGRFRALQTGSYRVPQESHIGVLPHYNAAVGWASVTGCFSPIAVF